MTKYNIFVSFVYLGCLCLLKCAGQGVFQMSETYNSLIYSPFISELHFQVKQSWIYGKCVTGKHGPTLSSQAKFFCQPDLKIHMHNSAVGMWDGNLCGTYVQVYFASLIEIEPVHLSWWHGGWAGGVSLWHSSRVQGFSPGILILWRNWALGYLSKGWKIKTHSL